jgi:8-amino-7-oxononanoate synthase
MDRSIESAKRSKSGECPTTTTAQGGLFRGFFSSKKSVTFDRTSLVDSRARRLFDMTRRACDAGVYPFQLALEGRSGPWIQAEGRQMLMLSSYDYLGLIGDPRVDQAAIEAVQKYGTGTGGVRMLTGTIDLHHQMESELAAFIGMAETITFSSGYLANLAVVSCLLSPLDRVVIDSLAHRSLVDACRLAGVSLSRFAHNDCASLRRELEATPPAGRTLIVADGVFSMEGDICPLPELIELKKEFGCYLMIDEAHALGVLGPSGRGTHEHFGVAAQDVDIWTGSLAKAIPSNGGFAAVSQELAIYMQHSAAPFIFSAALCPAAVGAIRESLAILKSGPERVGKLKQSADYLREGLRELGYNVGASETPIIPVILGDEATTTLFAGRLRELGVLVTPVLFPAVPQGAARLRLCVTAAHTSHDLEFALDAFRRLQGGVSASHS